MPGEMPSEQFEDLSKLGEELEKLPGEIEEAPEPEVLEMEEPSKEEIEEIHEQREQVEKTIEASAELLAAMVSESESPEETKMIMEKADRISSLVLAETVDIFREKPLETVEALGDEHKGVNSSYILRLVEKRISVSEGREEVAIRQAVYKPKEGVAGGVEWLKFLWEDPTSRAMLEKLGVNLEGGKKIEDFFPGFEKNSLRPGIEKDSLHLREWLASMIDMAMRTNVVPPTVLRIEKDGVGSIQEFILGAKSHDEDPARQIDDEEMRRMAIFDVAVGTLDKHGGNYMAGGKLSGRESRKGHQIDNGYILSEAELGDLDIISKPLEQFNPERAEGGRAIDPTLSASQEKSLGKFLESKKMQGALKKCFDIAIGTQPEAVWKGFITRIEKIHSEKKLPTNYSVEAGKVAIGDRMMRELIKASSASRTEQEAAAA